MAKLKTIADVLALRDRLVKDGETMQTFIEELRKVRERRMEDILKTFVAGFPPEIAEHFVPVQTAELDNEVRKLVALCMSNEPVLELVSLSDTQAVKTQLQKLEYGSEALYSALNTQSVRMMRLDSIFAEPYSVLACDRLQPGEWLAGYADHEALKKHAESRVDDEDDDSTEPEAEYTRAYRKTKDHEQAYGDATKEAKKREGLRWRWRTIDNKDFRFFADDIGVETGMEVAEVPLERCIDLIAGYGVKRDGTRLVTKGNGPALGQERYAYEAQGWCEQKPDSTVTYTQIRTREAHYILVEGVVGQAKGEGDILISFETPFARERKTTGYYVAAGSRRNRGENIRRYQPVVLPLYVECQVLNIVKSMKMAMAYYEATRGPYEQDEQAGPQPVEKTNTARAKRTKGERNIPTLKGELKLAATSGIDLDIIEQRTQEAIDRYVSREFFSGSGSAGEPALHLARLQTAQGLLLVPPQTEMSVVDKEALLDILATVKETGEPIYINRMPQLTKGQRDGVQSAETVEITPEMCKLPFEVRISNGADTPEAKSAQQEVWWRNVERGAIDLDEYMQVIGVKDIGRMKRRIAVQGIVGALTPWMQEQVTALLKSRAQTRLDTLFPPVQASLGEAPVDIPTDQVTQPEGPLGPNPVQFTEGSVPVAPGGGGIAV